MSQSTALSDDELATVLSDPAAQAWFEKHLADMRRDAYGRGSCTRSS